MEQDTLITMSYERWVEIFQPIWSDENKDRARDFNFNDDEDYQVAKKAVDEDRIWSVLEIEEEEEWLVTNGYHWVNVLEYWITEKPYDPEKTYEILY